jgi:hypothetical protein
MRIWYNLVSKVFDYYKSRLTKDIPEEAVDICTWYKIDLYEVRFNKAVLSVRQVDTMLDHMSSTETYLAPQTRLTIKNMLVQARCMEEGYVYRPNDGWTDELDNKITGVQFNPKYANPKIWPHDPVIQPGTYAFTGTVNSKTVQSMEISNELKTNN